MPKNYENKNCFFLNLTQLPRWLFTSLILKQLWPQTAIQSSVAKPDPQLCSDLNPDPILVKYVLTFFEVNN
jgi:hypothetical protein